MGFLHRMKTVGKIRLEFGVNCPYLVRPIGFFTCILPTIINDVRIQRLAASLCYQFVIDFSTLRINFSLIPFLSNRTNYCIESADATGVSLFYWYKYRMHCLWRVHRHLHQWYCYMMYKVYFTYDLPPQITAIDLSVTHFIIGSREFYSPESSGLVV